jgi:hypothetical protein
MISPGHRLLLPLTLGMENTVSISCHRQLNVVHITHNQRPIVQ